MKKLSLVKWHWVITFVLTIAFLGATIFMVDGQSNIAQAKGVSPKTVTIWIQVTDSCKHALPGATFQVTGPSISTITTPTNGTIPTGISTVTTPANSPIPAGISTAATSTNGAIPEGLSSHSCPVQQGNCVTVSAGCTSIALNVPTSGSFTYKITVAQTAPGREQTGNPVYGANWTFAICNGGSDCSEPEVGTVKITSSGEVSATVLNTYPDGTTVTWPTTEKAFSGTQQDPIMFHEFGISQTSGPANQCDGDQDADDYLTGTPGRHCDSERDNK